MSAARTVRVAILPAVAAVLIALVVGVQFAYGGGDFVPLRGANPCTVRTASSVSTGVDGLSERLVLLGLDGAACRLHTSREALTLQLAESSHPTDAQVAALRYGLLRAVDLMNAAHQLPPASDLVDAGLAGSNLNSFLKAAIRALPASVINRAVSTPDVLRRTIDNLDLRALLANVDNPDNLNAQINTAVTKAVQQSVVAALQGLL